MKAKIKRKILLVDDHPMLRAGVARTIQNEKDLCVCGEAGDAREALQKIAATKPDLAIVDLSLDGTNGLELLKSIRSRNGTIRLLVFSTHNEAIYAEPCLKAGANGYIMKRQNGPALIAAIRTVLDGKTYLTEEIKQIIVDKTVHSKPKGHEPHLTLTNRELETFRLIGQGFGTRQIAEALHISMKTVEAHREHIRAKYGLSSNFQLVQKAMKWVHQETPLL